VDFDTRALPTDPDEIAPDGSQVRVLLILERGGLAHFRLDAGQTSRATAHKSVEELWYIVSGRGEMWRKRGEQEEIVAMEPGVCLSIPTGTWFQFRAAGDEALSVVGATMPPWPGRDEAYAVEGVWEPTVP
jgi:mannose-6-phosphate isomerase-like protein (cupin superfamily)